MLDTANPDRLISISTMDTFNSKINVSSFHFSYFSSDQRFLHSSVLIGFDYHAAYRI